MPQRKALTRAGERENSRAVERVGREQRWGDSTGAASGSGEKEWVGEGPRRVRGVKGRCRDDCGSRAFGEGAPTLFSRVGLKRVRSGNNSQRPLSMPLILEAD